MQCKRCGRQFPDDWEFCTYCRWKKEQAQPVCPVCGKPVNPGAVFCAGCGARLSGAQAQPPQQFYYPAQPGAPGKPRAGLWWLVGGGAVVFIAAAVLVALALTGKLQQASPTDAGTLKASATLRAGSAKTPVATPTPTPMPTAKTLDTSEPVRLRWFVYSFVNQADQSLVMDRVNDYLSGKINTTIELNTVDFTDYDARIDALIAANDPFDLMETASWIADFRKHSAAGDFLPLDSLVRDYGVDIQAAAGRNLRGCMYNGKLYGLPALEYPYRAYGLMLRKDLVDKYGIDVSKYHSLADMATVFSTIKQNEPDVHPLFVDGTSSPYLLLGWDKFGNTDEPGALYPNNGLMNTRVLNDYAAPESVQLYKLMQGFYDEGYVDDGAARNTDAYTAEQSSSDFAFIRTMYPGAEADMKESSGREWVQMPITQPVTSRYDAASSMLAIPAISTNPERAMLFCDLLYTDAPLLNLLDYGIEGTHYDVTGTNTIRVRSSSGYSPLYIWQFGNVFLTYNTEGQPQDRWARVKSINDTCLKLNDLGFWFDGSAFSDEQTACEKVVGDYFGGLNSGSARGDVDATVAQFESDLKAVGADTVIAEMQRQYDAWRAEYR